MQVKQLQSQISKKIAETPAPSKPTSALSRVRSKITDIMNSTMRSNASKKYAVQQEQDASMSNQSPEKSVMANDVSMETSKLLGKAEVVVEVPKKVENAELDKLLTKVE